MKTVIYSAAHGGFDLTRVPLGGAASVYDQLTDAWQKKRPFDLQLLTPAILAKQAPRDKDLVQYSERRYARFCFEFENAVTQKILRQDPRETVVLSNDVSEGPRFRLLAEKGFPVYTIYHVNVVDYFAAIYLRGWVRPETVTRLHQSIDNSPLRHVFPNLLKLIFEKQRDSLLYSKGVIVPSEGMKRILLRCYPGTAPEKIHVLPWGSRDNSCDETAVNQKADELRRRYGIPPGGRVLLTLSRISPEKGQDRLLRALELWEHKLDFPAQGVWAILCGEAAYMQGRRFQKRLEKLAKRLKKVHVIFPGYLAGLEKQAHFRLADLYVFPSRHESYGLTLLEAYRAGLPALACDHYGSEGLVRPEFGELLPAAQESNVPRLLQQTLQRLLADPDRLRSMGKAAREFAEARTFSETADQLAKIISA